MRILVMTLATLLASAAFALGIIFFAKPGQIKEALEPIPTSSYQPSPPTPSTVPTQDQQRTPTEAQVLTDDFSGQPDTDTDTDSEAELLQDRDNDIQLLGDGDDTLKN